VVDAFLAAARDGDFYALLAVLDPDVVLRADLSAVHAVGSREVRGGPAVARSAAKGREPGPHDQRLSTEPWESSWLHVDGSLWYSAS
jgi:hypothetical protein